MKHVITNAAEITILEPIDNTYKTGGGPVSVGATCVVASKGLPFKVKQVLSDSWQDYFGKPLPKKSVGMEGLRHLADAAKKCNYINAVRVVAADAKFPSMAFRVYRDKPAWATATEYKEGDLIPVTGGKLICIEDHTSTGATAPTLAVPSVNFEVYTGPVETASHAYGTSLSVGDGMWMVLYPIDGDPSTTRQVRIEKVNATTKRFRVAIYETDAIGDLVMVERLEVGIDPEDVDDMGRPAYIEAVFEQQSDHFRVDFKEGLTWADLSAIILALKSDDDTPVYNTFVGGTNGGAPTTEDWIKGWDLFRNEHVYVHDMFAAGNYDEEVIENCAEIADDRHCRFYYDCPPSLPPSQAMAWNKAMGLRSRHSRCYYAPFGANDRWRDGKTVWGASGAAAAAKATGNANFTGNVPGIHYAPAGEKRAVLARTGVVHLHPDEILNRDDFYDARINPVVVSPSGGAVIDDDLVQHFMQNYTRFGWVNDILDYIDWRFLEAAQYAKFEPDGLTRSILYSLTKEILDQLVVSGALVNPRYPEEDGITTPYVITIKQLEIDLWHVQWDVCPTGAARRIAGQPKLIR